MIKNLLYAHCFFWEAQTWTHSWFKICIPVHTKSPFSWPPFTHMHPRASLDLSSSLPRAFSALPRLRALLYKPLIPSTDPYALHFLLIPDHSHALLFGSNQKNLIFFVLSANSTAMTGTTSEQYSSVHDLTVKVICSLILI